MWSIWDERSLRGCQAHDRTALSAAGPPPLAGVPVKSFTRAKGRLSDQLDPADRAGMARLIASHVLSELKGAGATPIVVAGSLEVAEWATEHGIEAIDDPDRGLNGAAATVVSRAAGAGRPWLVVHADLPLLRSADLAPAIDAVRGGKAVIAPSHDGGSNLIGSARDRFEFAYGPASFHRHLQRIAHDHPRVLTGLGLMLDIDSPADLEACLRHPRGAWLAGKAAIRSAS